MGTGNCTCIGEHDEYEFLTIVAHDGLARSRGLARNYRRGERCKSVCYEEVSAFGVAFRYVSLSKCFHVKLWFPKKYRLKMGNEAQF